MNETIITWNVPNWITIFLMALGGFAVLSFAANLWKNKVTANGA